MLAPQMGHDSYFSHTLSTPFNFFPTKAKRVILLEVLESLTKCRAAGPGGKNEQIISNPVVLAFYFLSLLLSGSPSLAFLASI